MKSVALSSSSWTCALSVHHGGLIITAERRLLRVNLPVSIQSGLWFTLVQETKQQTSLCTRCSTEPRSDSLTTIITEATPYSDTDKRCQMGYFSRYSNKKMLTYLRYCIEMFSKSIIGNILMIPRANFSYY